MKGQLLVLLLGGREPPALMTAERLAPDAVYYVVSADEPAVVGRVTAWLQEHLPQTEQMGSVAAAPYRPAETQAAVLKAVRSHPSLTPAVSLTGAPLPMAIGGYDAARELECAAYYLNSAAGELLDVTRRDAPRRLPSQRSVRDFVAANGVSVKEEAPLAPEVDAQQREAAQWMARDVAVTTELLRWLTAKEHVAGRTRTSRWTLGEQHRLLLEELGRCDILRKVQVRSDEEGRLLASCVIPNVVSRRFLEGIWLERYVDTLACSLEHDGEPLFDDCMWSLHLWSAGTAEREIDVIGVRHGLGVIISCKTAVKESWEKGNLDELTAVGKLLGGDYCTKVYVTSQPRPGAGQPRHEAVNAFLDWAEHQRVTVVTGDQLPQLAEILIREATTPRHVRK